MAIEHELKFLLSAAHAERLLEWAEATHGARPTGVEQENVYYDTPDGDFSARKWMFRTRFKKGKKQTTLKTPIQDELGLKNREYECELPEHFDHAGPTLELVSGIEVFDTLRALAKANGFEACLLERTGHLKTTRFAFVGPDGVSIELDHSFYGNTEDWELECESEQAAAANQILVAWFKSLGVAARANKRSKYVRMLAATAVGFRKND